MKKTTKTLSFLFALAFVLASFSFVSSAAKDVSEESLKEILPSEKTLCLPFGSDITQVKFVLDADEYSIAGGDKKPFSSGMTIDVTNGKSEDGYYNPCYKVTFYKDGKQSIYSVYVLSELPTIYIGTSKGTDYIHNNRENRDKDAKILICDSDGKTVYSDVEKGTSSEIKTRGNATFKYDKKPYQIKLDKKTDLFGMGKAKTWILLANFVDESHLRNAISFKVAEALELDFTPKSVFVNLYVDNEFRGLYQLCEKTQIGSNRIEIFDLEEETEKTNKGKNLDGLDVMFEMNRSVLGSNLVYFSYVNGVADPEDITGGYLVELDNVYSYREKCRFQTKYGNTYVVKSPECASYEQMKYISALVSDMEEALYSDSGYNSKGKHYSDYVDVDSLLKTYIVAEICKNFDAYTGSTFYYKDRDENGVTSKIYSGPIWDYDNAFGNQSGSFADDKTEIWAAGSTRVQYTNMYGYNILKHSEFAAKFSEYYKTAAICIYGIIEEGGYLDKTVEKIYSSVAADKSRWKSKRAGTRIYNSDETSSVIGFLRDFMKQRTDGLWDFFVGADVPVVVSTTAEETTATTSEATTIAETTPEPTTAAVTAEATTAAPTTVEPVGTTAEETTEQPSGGCGSAISSALVIPAALAVLVFVKKKKKNECE